MQCPSATPAQWQPGHAPSRGSPGSSSSCRTAAAAAGGGIGPSGSCPGRRAKIFWAPGSPPPCCRPGNFAPGGDVRARCCPHLPASASLPACHPRRPEPTPGLGNMPCQQGGSSTEGAWVERLQCHHCWAGLDWDPRGSWSPGAWTQNARKKWMLHSCQQKRPKRLREAMTMASRYWGDKQGTVKGRDWIFR